MTKTIVLLSFLLTISVASAGECTMSFAALSQFDDFETSFYDHKNKTTIQTNSATECVSQATKKLGTNRQFKSENRFTKRDENRKIAIVNYTFTEEEISFKGKVELTRTPSSLF